MSNVEDTLKVDAISVDKETNEVILNIFDHLDWKDEKAHLAALEGKISNYIKFVETKEIETVYPDSVGKKIKISVVAKFSLTGNGLKYIAKATQKVTEAGLTLDHSFLKRLKTEA
jgi:hypothetical protein